MSALKVLRELPGIAELERRALMEPKLRAMIAFVEFPEVEETAVALFGTASGDFVCSLGMEGYEALANECPFWEDEALETYAARGWDVSDGHGRLAYMFEHFGVLLAGHITGRLPLNAAAPDDAWGASIAEQAKRFRPGRGKP